MQFRCMEWFSSIRKAQRFAGSGKRNKNSAKYSFLLLSTPAMAPYIFMERNGIHIIDLHKTVAKVDEAAEALKQIAKSGKTQGSLNIINVKKYTQSLLN